MPWSGYGEWWEEREALREEVRARVERLFLRVGKEGRQHAFLAREHVRLATDPDGANREHHLLYALRHLLAILEEGSLCEP